MTDRIAYSVREAAEATGLSPDSIRRAYRSGALTIHYPNGADGKVLILRTDLESWITNAPTERATA